MPGEVFISGVFNTGDIKQTDDWRLPWLKKFKFNTMFNIDKKIFILNKSLLKKK